MAMDNELFVAGTASGDSTTLGGTTADEIAVLDAVDVPIIVISREYKVVRINRAAMTVFGLKLSDLGCPLGNTLAGVEDLLRIAPYTGSDRQILGAVLTFTNVTAFRASIEQAIYEREYTKGILNTVVDPVIVLDTKLQVRTANKAFYTIFGVSRDQTQGISIRKLGNNEWETSEVWESVETTLSGTHEFQAVEIDREFPTGRRTLVLDARRLAGAGDSLIVVTFHDVTERKQAERTTSLLAAIVDSSDDAILSKKLDGTITSWNQSAEHLFGYTAEEAIGQHITLIVPWERRAEEEDILRRMARGERVEHFETVRRGRDGTYVDVSLAISPIRDAAGGVIGASNVARDITERRQAERALSEQARLLDLSNDAIFVRDAEDHVTYWNKAAAELYGFTREEALGQVNHELLQTQFPDHLEKINERLHRDGSWNGELVHTRKDGTKVIVISRWALDRKANGNTLRILETNSDITQQKRTEKALRESEDLFRALVHASSDVVYRMSPDWSEMRELDGREFIADTRKSTKDWLNEYIHPDDQPLMLRTIRGAVRTKSMFELEHRIQRTNGTLCWP